MILRKKAFAMILATGMFLGTFVNSTYTADLNSTNQNIRSMSIKDAADLSKNTQELIEMIQAKFSDIPKNYWASTVIGGLVKLGVIDGYTDGTFKPEGTVNADEFIKMLVTGLGEKVEKPASGYWAQPYIDRAQKLELTSGVSFNNKYDRPIRRDEVSSMINSALIYYLHENTSNNIEEYKNQIRDFGVLESKEESILNCYSKGIITGYPDGRFRYDLNVTRAEASAMLVRLLDKNQRKVPRIQKIVKKDFVEPIIEVHYQTQKDTPSFYRITVDNIYEFSDEYEFKIENVTYPQFNLRCPEWGTSVYTIDITKWKNAKEIYNSYGQLYTLYEAYYAPREVVAKYPLKKGMKLQYKITVKKGNKQKSYYTTAVIQQ